MWITETNEHKTNFYTTPNPLLISVIEIINYLSLKKKKKN
jgi:hypothetical protein